MSILLLGESGAGKSTFVNTLCDEDIIPTNRSTPAELIIEEYHANLDEGGTRISLDITMCPGFGDYVNNEASTARVVKLVEGQFENVLNEECRINRNPKFKDTRIHAVLYFIRPTGKGLRELDIQCLQQLSRRCNIIPIMSKADFLTNDERKLNRELIMSDIKMNGITIYDFSSSFDDVDDSGEDTESIMNLVPFSIISGTERKIIDQVEYKVRSSPHGVIRVDDPFHSDFLILRTCLLGACLQDLKETTHSVFYEKFRSEKLTSNNLMNVVNGRD